ncbi:hypothetical protein [Myxococcus sp. Y35]|uniref:hypothetical protein n=1 Tax=Pseudomyxococcus flavus TaxID=3115648 RepID=UPI003CEB7687
MTLRRPLCAWSLSLCLGLAAPALAQEERSAVPETPQTVADPTDTPNAPSLPALGPDVRLYVTSFNVVRWNPLGLESQNRLLLQKRMFDGDSILTRDNFINGGLSFKANPANLKLGPTVEFQPLAILNLRATYEFVQFMGTMGFLQSYTDPRADFSDDARDLTDELAYSTSGHHYIVEPTLQAKFGSIVVRAKASIEYWNMDLREGSGATFYDPLLDSLIPARGWVFTNDSDLLLLATPRLTMGARFSAVWPRYTDAMGAGAASVDNSHMRVGPLVAYSLSTREFTTFSKPTVILQLAWYLKHPNRMGAMPYMIAGFAFTSDLLGGQK